MAARLRPAIAKKEDSVTPGLFEAPEPKPADEPFGDKEEVEAQPEPKVEAKPEPAPEPKVEEPKVDAAAEALRRQVEELRRSELLLREQNSQYQQRLVERDRRVEESEETTISVALQGARDRADKARVDIQNARNDSDMATELEAQERLNFAIGDLRDYQRAKDEIEARKKAPKPEPQPQQPQYPLGSDAEINSWQVPERAKTWAREHRDWVTEPGKRQKMMVVTEYLTRLGIPLDSDDFYVRAETELGIKAPEPPPPQPQQTQQPQPERRVPVSAPVSREVASSASGSRQSNDKVTLTADQKEAAKMSGVTEVEYAKQLLRLKQMRESGEYGDRR
jgi:hypothetical protein